MSEIHQVNLVLDLLSHDTYRQYNVTLAKRLGGIEYAIILNDLIDQYKYLSRTNQLISNVKFGDCLMYYTQQQAYDRCGVLKDSFEKALKIFIDLEFISDIVKFGMPQKRYLRLNILKIHEWAFSNNVCRVRKSANKLAEIRQHDSGNPLTNDKENDSYNNSKNRSPSISPPPKPILSSSLEKDKIGFFDPFSYVLRNQEKLSVITARTFAKKMKDPALSYLIVSNVRWYEQQCDKGAQINSHEKYLQNAINKDFAGKEDNKWKNELYAKVMRDEHRLHGMKILKTVVQLEKQPGVPPESISYTLPEKTFCDAIDNYIKFYKK